MRTSRHDSAWHRAAQKRYPLTYATCTGLSNQANLELWPVIYQAYSEPHRYYHTMDHLEAVFEAMYADPARQSMNMKDLNALDFAALFHDFVYVPGASNNEERSAAAFVDLLQERGTNLSNFHQISRWILRTKECPAEYNTSDWIGNILIRADQKVVHSTNMLELINWEHGIFKEYQAPSVKDYREGRSKFLKSCMEFNHKLEDLRQYMLNRPLNIGVYAGSFNPFHVGHFEILNQAERVFDKVIIAQGLNPEKSAPEYDVRNIARLKTRELHQYSGMLTDFLDTLKEPNVQLTLIRGLRNGDDLAYEEHQMQWILEMDPTVKFVFFHAPVEFGHISSSSLRSIGKVSPRGQEKMKKFVVW